jgi:hypothetical protein
MSFLFVAVVQDDLICSFFYACEKTRVRLNGNENEDIESNREAFVVKGELNEAEAASTQATRLPHHLVSSFISSIKRLTKPHLIIPFHHVIATQSTFRCGESRRSNY